MLSILAGRRIAQQSAAVGPKKRGHAKGRAAVENGCPGARGAAPHLCRDRGLVCAVARLADARSVRGGLRGSHRRRCDHNDNANSGKTAFLPGRSPRSNYPPALACAILRLMRPPPQPVRLASRRGAWSMNASPPTLSARRPSRSIDGFWPLDPGWSAMGWRELGLVVAAGACSAALIVVLLPMFRRYALARPNARSSHHI